MAPVDWYRTQEWDNEAKAHFEAKLARARTDSRPQYLRIKALALREAGDSASAVSLLRRVLDEYPSAFDAAFSAELLGELAAESGDHHAAETEYRRSLALRPDQNATSGEVHIGLAEALLGQERYAEALEALNTVPVADLTLNHAVCRWNVALAEAAGGLGERQVAAAAAARALDLLDAPDQFRRHSGVGRAVLSDEQVARLRKLASGA